MKTLLPILKTKLVLLSFVFACTAILANNYIQREDLFKFSEAKEEKLIAAPDKVAVKTKKFADKKLNLQLRDNLFSAASTSFNATVQTDKPDYVPGEYVIITGSGWNSGETVDLHIVSDCGCTDITNTAVANGNGDIYNNEFLITEAHLHSEFILTATGQQSNQIAVTSFTDATFVVTTNMNWSAIDMVPGGAIQSPTSGDAIIVRNNATLTVDVNNAVCDNIQIGNNSTGTAGNGTLLFNAGSQVTVSTDVTLGSGGGRTGSIDMTLGGTLKIADEFIGTLIGTFIPGTGIIEYNSNGNTNDQTILAGITYNHVILSGSKKAFIAKNTNVSITVNGNFTVNKTGDEFIMSDGNGNATLNIAGNYIHSAGTNNMGANNGAGTINVAGNFSITGGTITESGNGNGFINFNGTGTPQAYTSGGTVSNTINFTVNTNAFLQMATAGTTVTGAGTFTLQTGATLGIKSTAGMTSTAGTGNIQVTGARSYSTGASYVYNGSAAQATGNQLPATVSNLTFNNTGGAVTFNAARVVTNNFSITTGSVANLGTFTHTAGTLTLGGFGTAPGSWGHSASPAVNENDIFFANNTGIVNVSNSTACPSIVITATGTPLTLGCNPSASDINAALGSATASDGCGIPTVTANDGAITSSGCSRQQTRTFTAIDALGSTATAARTASWTHDVTPPVFSGDYTDVNLGCNPANPSGSLGIATASDACSSPTITSTDGGVVSTGCNRSQTRVFTAEDGCGNSSTASRTVNWTVDVTAPGFTGDYSDVNLGCNPANPAGSLGTATATDFCGIPTITHVDGSVVSEGCNRSITRTFTAEDGCDNSSTASRTVRWKADITPPVFSGDYNDVNLGCNPTDPAITAALFPATASDACSSTTITFVDGSVVSTGCVRSKTRTFTAEDDCDNSSTTSRTVHWIEDVTAPGFTGSYADVNLGCNPANPAGSLGTATATDFCGSPTITHADGSVVSNGCNRSQTRVFTAEDGCDNSSTTSRTVTWIVDVIPPVLTGSYIDVNLGCNPADPSGSLGTATANDFCGSPTITHADGSIESNGCARSITRTFTAEDGCHNTATVSRTVRWIHDLTHRTDITVG